LAVALCVALSFDGTEGNVLNPASIGKYVFGKTYTRVTDKLGDVTGIGRWNNTRLASTIIDFNEQYKKGNIDEVLEQNRPLRQQYRDAYIYLLARSAKNGNDPVQHGIFFTKLLFTVAELETKADDGKSGLNPFKNYYRKYSESMKSVISFVTHGNKMFSPREDAQDVKDTISNGLRSIMTFMPGMKPVKDADKLPDQEILKMMNEGLNEEPTEYMNYDGLKEGKTEYVNYDGMKEGQAEYINYDGLKKEPKADYIANE